MSIKLTVNIQDAFEFGYKEGQKDLLKLLEELYEVSADKGLVLKVIRSRVEKTEKNQELIRHLQTLEKGLDK